MGKEKGNEKTKNKITRREAISTVGKVAIGAVIAGAVAGTIGYYTGTQAAPTTKITITKTIPSTITVTKSISPVTAVSTVTKTLTKTITTKRVYPTVPEKLKAFRDKHIENILRRLMDEAKAASIDWKQFAGTTITTCIRTGPEADMVLRLAKMFEKLSGIKVKVDIVPETHQVEKVTADVLEETGIYDVPWLDLYRPVPYVANHKLEPLEQYIEDPKLTDKEFFKPEGFYPEIWRACNAPPYGEKGEHYFVPFYWHNHVIHWRRDIFYKYGFSIQDISSFYDVVETARKLNKPEEGFYGFVARGVVGDSGNMAMFLSWLLGMGADYLDEDYKPAFNTPEGIEALKLFVEAFKYAPPGAASYHFPEDLTALAEGKVAMCQEAAIMSPMCWDPTIAKPPALCNVWMARIPKGPAGRFAGLSGWTYGIPVGAKNKKAAWLWIEFTCSPLGIAALNAFKFMIPPRPEIWEDPDFAAILPTSNYKEIKQFSMRFDSHYGDQLSHRIPEGIEVMYTMSEAVNAAITGTKTPEEALAWAEERVKEIMRKAGYYK